MIIDKRRTMLREAFKEVFFFNFGGGFRTGLLYTFQKMVQICPEKSLAFEFLKKKSVALIENRAGGGRGGGVKPNVKNLKLLIKASFSELYIITFSTFLGEIFKVEVIA